MEFAAHQTNERRFACFVWAHQDGHATLLDIERYGVDQRATTRAVTDRLRREKSAQTPRPSLRRIKSQRKNGAPSPQDPDWHFRGRNQRAGEGVGASEKRLARRDAERQERAMIRADDKPHRVWRDDANEADDDVR